MALLRTRALFFIFCLLAGTTILTHATCVPQVSSAAPILDALQNPPTTTATFWSTAESSSMEIAVSVPTELPMQLQVLVDVNGQTVAEATELVNVLKQVTSVSDLFGSTIGATSSVAMRLYTESTNAGPVMQLGGGSLFETDSLLMVEALAVSYLLANEEPSTPMSTRLLDLSAEILSSWPQTHSTSPFSQILLVVAPNSFTIDDAQWNSFIAAVRSSHVLPVFYSARSDVAWQTEFSARWTSAFPGSSVPIFLGSQTLSTQWQNFNLASPLTFARQFLASGSPFISATPKILSQGVQSSADHLTVNVSLSLEPTATPFSAPSSFKVGVLGFRPIVVDTLLAQAPSGTSSVSSLQFLNRTALALPVSNDVSSIKVLSLPTQGSLFEGTTQITLTGLAHDPFNIFYQPHVDHSTSDSFTYMLQIPCGEWGPFTADIDLALVPLIPSAANSSLSLHEDDLTAKTIDLRSLVTNASPSATITLLSLPSMAGTLVIKSTGQTVNLSSIIPFADAELEFTLYRGGRGSFDIQLTYVVDNGLGATDSGVFGIQVTDVEHDPAAVMVLTDSYNNNFVAISDADNNTVSITLTASSNMDFCYWRGATNTCHSSTTSASFSDLQTPVIISIASSRVLLASAGTWTTLVTDSTARTTSMSGMARDDGLLANLLGGLLGGLLGLVGSLLSGLVSVLTLNPNVPSGATPSNCLFPILPSQASLVHNGAEASTAPWQWSTSDHTATYSIYDGVSGVDNVMFQCAFTKSSLYGTAPISQWQFIIPITKPNASVLNLDTAPDAPYTWIPIQGLISEGGLSIHDIVPTGGYVELFTGGIRFFATNTIGTVSYRLCSLLNSTLCSDIIENTINLLDAIPILGAPSQQFTARLNSTLNSFTIEVPANIDGIYISAISPLSIGTLQIDGSDMVAGGPVHATSTFTYQLDSSLPVTATLLSLASFSFTAVKNGKHSQAGTVFIVPDQADLLPLIPSITDSLTDLVETLDTVLETAVTLVPGFRIEVDVFGKKSGQNLYAQLLASVEHDSSKRDRNMAASEDVTVSATLDVPRIGRFEVCDDEVTCVLVDSSLYTTYVVTYNQTIFFTPPLLSALYEQLGLLRWTVRVVDALGRFLEVTVDGVLDLANDVLSDTLRLNVLRNTSPALQLGVPGVRKMLEGAGLEPDGCGEIPPSPLVCVGGQLIANDTVVVDSTTWIVSVETTLVLSGDLHLTPTGVLQLVYQSGATVHPLPFFNVSRDIVLDGVVQISISRSDLNMLIFGTANKRDAFDLASTMNTTSGSNYSEPITVMEAGRNLNSTASFVLLTEDTSCYGVTANPGHNGRPNMNLVFSFASDVEGCSTTGPDGGAGGGVKDANQRRRNQIIWIACAVAGGVLLILLVAAALIFRYNKNAKRLARPYSIRRLRGQAYRTQPSSEMTGSQGSAEIMPADLSSITPWASTEMREPDDIDDNTTTTSNTDQVDQVDHESTSAPQGDDDLADTEDTAMPQSPSSNHGIGPVV